MKTTNRAVLFESTPTQTTPNVEARVGWWCRWVRKHYPALGSNHREDVRQTIWLGVLEARAGGEEEKTAVRRVLRELLQELGYESASGHRREIAMDLDLTLLEQRGDDPADSLHWQFSNELEEFAALLDEPDITIIRGRLLSDEPHTLAEIGKRFGLSEARIRQRERRLKKRLKEFLENR